MDSWWRDRGGLIMFVPGIIASQKNFIDLEAFLVFRHRFNSTVNQTPELTDETGKSLIHGGFQSVGVKDNSPTPFEGSGYLGTLSQLFSNSGTFGIDGYLTDINFEEKGTLIFYLYSKNVTTARQILIWQSEGSPLEYLTIHTQAGATSSKIYLSLSYVHNGSLESTFNSSDIDAESWNEITINLESTGIKIKSNGSIIGQDSFSRGYSGSERGSYISMNPITTNDQKTFFDDFRIYKGIIV